MVEFDGGDVGEEEGEVGGWGEGGDGCGRKVGGVGEGGFWIRSCGIG